MLQEAVYGFLIDCAEWENKTLLPIVENYNPQPLSEIEADKTAKLQLLPSLENSSTPKVNNVKKDLSKLLGNSDLENSIDISEFWFSNRSTMIANFIHF